MADLPAIVFLAIKLFVTDIITGICIRNIGSARYLLSLLTAKTCCTKSDRIYKCVSRIPFKSNISISLYRLEYLIEIYYFVAQSCRKCHILLGDIVSRKRVCRMAGPCHISNRIEVVCERYTGASARFYHNRNT